MGRAAAADQAQLTAVCLGPADGFVGPVSNLPYAGKLETCPTGRFAIDAVVRYSMRGIHVIAALLVCTSVGIAADPPLSLRTLDGKTVTGEFSNLTDREILLKV